MVTGSDVDVLVTMTLFPTVNSGNVLRLGGEKIILFVRGGGGTGRAIRARK